MFAVIFEVQPRSDRWETYLGLAGALRPELVAVDGFIDNVRYGSLRREGWLLSLSTWRDEKALVRWRTNAPHHAAQEQGRNNVFRDYHLRVGQVTADSHPPQGYEVHEQRFDETEDGVAKQLSIMELRRPPGLPPDATPEQIADSLGLQERAHGLVEWDVFDAILTPGDLLLLLAWRDTVAAEPGAAEPGAAEPGAAEPGAAELGERALSPEARHRRVRVVRDYGMFRRHEAPQYYPEVAPH
jgi:heme-degrading monooxygenase HmoA